jgi:hypothetical protein
MQISVFDIGAYDEIADASTATFSLQPRPPGRAQQDDVFGLILGATESAGTGRVPQCGAVYQHGRWTWNVKAASARSSVLLANA